MRIQKADKIVTFDMLNSHRDAQSATIAIVEQRSNGRKVNLKKPTFDYGRREIFSPPEYNLMEIGVIEDVESYVRQSFQKKTALMFKEGYELTGKNKDTIEYMKKRFQQIEHVSGICFNDLLRQTGHALLSRSNFFWVKARNAKASGGRTIAGIQPIAGYFPMGAENVEVKKNKRGKVIKYRQKMPDGRFKEFSPKDVIHFHAYRKTHFAFGTPAIVPVKEDIRALRRIEENVELLIYQVLFPIFQYKVGTENKPAADIRLSDGTIMSEVEYVRRQIQDMPAEGGIVTPERHEIEYIGAEGKALKAKEYLEYFKQRVFTGLGMSGVDMGEGGTANRACYSGDTQTLTDSGFKYYWEITENDKIATYNPENNQMEFHFPNDSMYLYDYSGPMYHFKNRNIDTLVTPDHDMWASSALVYKNNGYKKIHAEDIKNNKFKFLTGGLEWNGFSPEDFKLPYVPYKKNILFANNIDFNRIKIEDWLEFLGYYVSEGTLAKCKDKWAVSISQSLAINPGKTKKIRECLKRLPFKFNEYLDNDGTVRFWINCKSLYLYLLEECKDYSYRKQLPEEIVNYSSKLVRIVFEAMMTGDGTTDQREGRTSRTYYSNSERLIDQTQEMALKLGYRAHILPGTRCQRVCISKRIDAEINQNQIQVIDYSGQVYCFNIENHLFITRRNGRIGIHGNTADTLSRTMVDSVKDYQDIMQEFLNKEVFKELLLESTFNFDVLDSINKPLFKFKEIDIEEQLKKNTNAQVLYNGNIIDVDEARSITGQEPITEEQEGKMYVDRVELRKTNAQMEGQLEIAKVGAAAKAANAGSSTSNGSTKAAAAAKNSNAPTNQHGTKTGPQKTRLDYFKIKDGFISNVTKMLRNDITKHVKNQIIDRNWINTLINMGKDNALKKYLAVDRKEFVRGLRNVSTPPENIERLVITDFQVVKDTTTHYINKYMKDINGKVQNIIDQMIWEGRGRTEIQEAVGEIFDKIKYRGDFIDATERMRAYNYGKAVGLRDQGFIIAPVVKNPNCESCQDTPDEVDLQNLNIFSVPPFHPNSTATISKPME